jgi:hypothetical protein
MTEDEAETIGAGATAVSAAEEVITNNHYHSDRLFAFSGVCPCSGFEDLRNKSQYFGGLELLRPIGSNSQCEITTSQVIRAGNAILEDSWCNACLQQQ